MNDIARASKRRSIAIFYEVAYPFLAGGGERRLYEIGRRFAARGWTVHWYTLHHWDGPATQERDGITYYGLRGNTRFYGSDGKRSTRQAFSYAAAVLRCKAKFETYDLVLCGQWPLFHLFSLFARRVPFRSRLVVDWWETWGRHWFDYLGPSGIVGWTLEQILARLVTKTAHAVVMSPKGQDQLIACGARPDRIVYIPNGIDLTSLSAGPAERGSVDVVYFGRLKDHKNVDHLLWALHILKSHNRLLTADIIGDGPERAALEALVQRLGIAEQVTFHGVVSDERLPRLLKRGKIFVHPGTKEGGGSITILEANACGLPIVCYSHPLGIDPNFVRDGETGLFVRAVDPTALADGIVDMLDRVAKRPVREFCLENARNHHWDAIFDRYERLASEVLGERGGDDTNPKMAA